jgi:hypothetical protein
MRMDELKGYRSHPLHQMAQQVLGQSRNKIRGGSSDPLDQFDEFMAQHGFDLVGSGSYGMVWEKQGYPWLFKVFMDDPAYLWWISWAVKHQDNPNVPRVKGLPVKIAPNTYVVRLEKLNNLMLRAGNLSRDYEKLAYLLSRIETVDDLSKEDLQWIRHQYPGIYDILRMIQKIPSRFALDLHSRNIMMRGETPVLIDPVV